MSFKLIVVHPFEDYGRGAEITDQAEIDRIMSTHAACVVKVASVPAETAAEAPPSVKSKPTKTEG